MTDLRRLPVLAGLRPETTDRYRLQGVAADGNLYRSEVLTFTTPAAAESPYAGNRALGADVVDVSSEFSAAFAATDAVAGDPNTERSVRETVRMRSSPSTSARKRRSGRSHFRTRTMRDGSSITETFTIETENSTYRPFPAGAPVEVSFNARRPTFRVESSTGGNAGAVEIEVYGWGNG